MDDVRMFMIDSIFSYKRQKWNNNVMLIAMLLKF